MFHRLSKASNFVNNTIPMTHSLSCLIHYFTNNSLLQRVFHRVFWQEHLFVEQAESHSYPAGQQCSPSPHGTASGKRQHPNPVAEYISLQQVLLYGHTVTTAPDLSLHGTGFSLFDHWKKERFRRKS